MKGNNTLILSPASMMDAVQQYLDWSFKSGLVPKVTSVKERNGAFEVETEEYPENKKVDDDT